MVQFKILSLSIVQSRSDTPKEKKPKRLSPEILAFNYVLSKKRTDQFFKVRKENWFFYLALEFIFVQMVSGVDRPMSSVRSTLSDPYQAL